MSDDLKGRKIAILAAEGCEFPERASPPAAVVAAARMSRRPADLPAFHRTVVQLFPRAT